MTYQGCPPPGGPCNYKPKVLVVDDQEQDLTLARLGLERQGFRVKTHQVTGPEDLVALQERIVDKQYAFAFFDTELGNVYGPTDLAKVVESSGTNVPYIAWSNVPSSKHRADWRETEAKGFFEKPMGMKGYQPIATAIRDSIDCKCNNN